MNTRQCKYFITLAEKKSFSEAAKELIISQPSLSQYIQKMEESFGVKLIDRSGSQIQLTLEGQYYYKVACDILEEEQKMANYFNDLKECKTGKIKIALSPYASSFLIPRILKDFYKKYPLIDLELLDYSSIQLVQGAQKGDFDIALTVISVDTGIFEVESVSQEEYVLVVPKEFEVNSVLHSNENPQNSYIYPIVDLKLLKDVPFITWNQISIINEHFEKLCEISEIHPRRIIECYSSHPMFQMVKQGIGAAILPSGIVKFMREYHIDDDVYIYRLLQNNYKFERIIVYKKGKYLTKPMKYLIQLIKKCN